MTSLQYVIDSMCASVTVECVYKMIEALLSEGQFTVAELLPLIQTKDRSLDLGSAKIIANSPRRHGTARPYKNRRRKYIFGKLNSSERIFSYSKAIIAPYSTKKWNVTSHS